MAERGEGAAAGGSYLRAIPSGTHTAKHRGRSGGVAATAGGVEGLEAAGGSPLPIRKRKIGITEVLEAKRRTTEEPQIPGNFASGATASHSGSNVTSPSSSSSTTTSSSSSSRKRRRAASSGSHSETKDANPGEAWSVSPNKRQQRSSNLESRGHIVVSNLENRGHIAVSNLESRGQVAVGNIESRGKAVVSLAANAPTTPTRNQASAAWRSSSRGSRGRKKTSAVQTCLTQSSRGENDNPDTSKPVIPLRHSKRLEEKNKHEFNDSGIESSVHSSGEKKEPIKAENVKQNIDKTKYSKKTESAKKAAELINLTLNSAHKSESAINPSKQNKCESTEGTRKGFRVTVIQNKLISKKGTKKINISLVNTGETVETAGLSNDLPLRKAKNTSQIKGFNKRKLLANSNGTNQENKSQVKNGKVSKSNCSSEANFGNQSKNIAEVLVSKGKPYSKLGNSSAMIKGGLKERVGGSNVPNQKNSSKVTSKKVVAVAQAKLVGADSNGGAERGDSGSSCSPANFEKSEKSSGGGGGILKSYPLRNRLRLSDGGGGGGGGHGGGGGSPLGTTRHFEHHQSQSLPSSPSSQGVAFLADTFRRLRDSRRSSQEQSSQSTSKRNSQSKDPRQATGTWKRTHGTKKSPLSSKRSSRSKTNNTGSCASSSQQGGRGCGKVSFGSSSGMSGSHGPTQDGSSSSSGPGTAASHQQGAPPQPCSAPGAPGAISSSVLATAAGNAANAGLHTAPSTSTTSSLLPTASLATLGDSESEESDMGRLEALLASRGLPPSLFGALGPRMQHILHRSVSSSISSKAQQLLVGLQASGDESEQLQAVIEMCQLLVMGNEDTLAGFPIKQVTPALINLLNMEHNFDMMNHACRALTYMMEALPRSSAVVVDAVPVFLEKLQVIQCMDVAEQSLTALDMLSRKHSKNILQAHGVSACLMFIDFFSTGAQRAALSITANCCQNLTADEFHYVADSLQLLSNRLTSQGDKKCVESVCLAYSRLVDCFQNDPNRLQEIAGHGLLNNIQQLLVMSPPVLSTVTFIMVMRMLSLMCNSCPQLAVELLKNNIANTLCYLLTNSTDPPPEQVELVSRTPQELYEITCLISELMPTLPSDGIFAIDGALQRPTGPPQETVTWQWQDDRAAWQNYSISDSRIIEMAHQSGEDEISLCIQGPAYTIDFHSMQQINDSSGTVRSVQRRLVPAGLATAQQPAAQAVDARATCLQEDAALASNLIRSLFSLLYEVYSSSAGPAVRYKCLRALLRMIHFSTPQLLQQVLKTQSVSSHLATMLSSHDLKIIVGAIQMTEILMQKLPEIFSIYFRREGVMHQIKRLCDPEITLGAIPAAKWSSPELSLIGARSGVSSGGGTPNSASPLLSTRPFNGNCLDSAPSLPTPPLQSEDKLQSPQMRISDVLKRKRTTNRMRSGPFRKSRQEDSSSSFSEFFMKNAGLGSGRESWRNLGGGRSKLMSGSNSGTSGGTSTGTGVSPSSGKTASFLSSLNPSRWGRCNPATPTPPHDSPVSKDKLSNNSSSVGSSGSSHSSSSHNSVGGSGSNKEVVRVWVREQAQRLNEQYFTSELQGTSHPALSVLNRLIAAIQQLDHEPQNSLNALSEISKIVSNSDISPFEVIHSGLVRCLLAYLTNLDKSPSSVSSGISDTSISNPLQYSVESNGGLLLPASSTPPREVRLRNFLHVFLGCPLDSLSFGGVNIDTIPVFSALVSKLNGCVNQLEQFPVKVHDLPGTALTGIGRGASTSAIKFFNTHQLKCNLQRHPDCSRLRQWRGGPVKVDPLALVQAIERYLVIRGYGRLRDDDDDNSDDDNSDEDIDDTLAAVTVNQSSSSHKLQFVIGDHVLPYNMTVYQAIRQFSSPTDASASEADTDTETPVSHSAIWLQTHTIYYRAVQEEEPTRSSGGRKGKASGSKPSPKKKADASAGDGSIVSGNHSVLEQYLQPTLPASVTVIDPSLEVLGLLRVLHAINRHYGTLYPPSVYLPPLPTTEFTNLKLSAKASRQLQDPLVIMTGNVPPWLPQIAYACPFLFPFETRQLLFYAVSFDRDRALQRLMDSSPELNSVDSSERVTPRLERRKRTVSRDDILKQAEAVINDLASSRAMLEIQYENEVGTGLGPTLEFYALVSRELQKADLELWRGDTITVEEGTEENPGKAVKYVNVNHGLYPLPYARNIKSAHVTKLKSKFRFLGKFMAKAVMDSRMLDLGLHPCVYKWLLGEERSLGLGDVSSLDPSLGNTLNRLHQTVMTKRRVQATAMAEDLSGAELQERLGHVTVDGCQVEDLALTFTLPGYPHIEFRKGGADMAVTINNIDQYLQLVVEWLVRDGVWRQMEALREGFESVFPIAQLQVFYPEELEQLFCGSSDSSQWDVKQLAECCRPDHGYTHSSRAVKFLLQILAEYNGEQQRSFLQFVTGSPRLPVGGFRSLSPALTIVRKTFEASENPDEFLPSVMTCVNYLKLPDYSSIDIMRAKLQVAAREGQHSFHLS